MKGKFQNYFKTSGMTNFRKSQNYYSNRNNRKPNKSIFERLFEGLCCSEGENFYNV